MGEPGSQIEEGGPHSRNKVSWCHWADVISEIAERWTPLSEVTNEVETVQNPASLNDGTPKVSLVTSLYFFHCLAPIL